MELAFSGGKINMTKYIIWKNNAPIATGLNSDARVISDWIYDRISSITGNEELAVEASSWAELATIGEQYDMSEYELILTVSEAD